MRGRAVTTGIALALRLELEALYADYVHCLDADRLEEWPEFFTEDCLYRITSAENYEAGLPLGIIRATSKKMLKDRVAALRGANVYEPQRYRHLVSSLRLTAEQADELEAEANFLVVRTVQDGDMTLFAAGRYVDRLRRDGQAWKFAERTVILDSRQIDTLLAIPI